MRGLFRGTLAMAQSVALVRMIDHCTITAPSPGRRLDPDTGQYTDAPGPVIYTGECELKTYRGDAGVEVDHASRDATTGMVILRLPADTSARVRPGHAVQIDTGKQSATYTIRREADGTARSTRAFILEVDE